MKKQLFLNLICAVGVLICFNTANAKDKWNINGTEYDVDTVIYKHVVGPGTTMAKYSLGKFPLLISVMEVDLSNPYVTFETCKGGDKGVCEETPVSMYKRNDIPGHDMIGATNGDFYFYTNVVENGIPRSGQFKKNECITNPVGRACMVLDENNIPYVDRVDFSGKITFGSTTTRLHTVNMQRLEWESTNGNQLNLYTNAYGTETEDCSGGTKVIISPANVPFFWSANKDIQCKVESIIDGNGVTQIPVGKAVLWGRGTSEDFLKTLALGDEITINLTTNLRSQPGLLTNFKELMGGSNHIIMKNGANVDEIGDRQPRTCLGSSKDKKTLYLVVFDGRQGSSAGSSMSECADVFRALGAWEAVNLDGGGSSIMIVNGDIINTPSDGLPRQVGNGCLVYSNAPVDEAIGNLKFAPRPYTIMSGAVINPVVYGYNKYWLLKNRDFKDATITCDPNIGRIENNRFIASTTPGSGKIYAKYGNSTCEQEVNIIDCDKKLRLSDVVVDDLHPYEIEVIGTNGEYSDLIDPSSINWTVTDPSICEVVNGTLKALKNGTTTITGNATDFNGTQNVTIYTPQNKVNPIDPDNNISGWDIKVSGGTNAQITPLGSGMNIAFTGASGRVRNIKITRKIEVPGIPESFVLKFNPEKLPLTTLTFVCTAANGTSVTKTVNLDINQDNPETTLKFSVKELFENEDRSLYPLLFQYMTFGMGTLTSGEAYNLAIPEFNVNYLSGSGVENIITDKNKPILLYPNPVSVGESVTLKNVSGNDIQRIDIYNNGGSLVKVINAIPENGCVRFSTNGLTPGIYFVKSGKLKAKLLVK